MITVLPNHAVRIDGYEYRKCCLWYGVWRFVFIHLGLDYFLLAKIYQWDLWIIEIFSKKPLTIFSSEVIVLTLLPM